MLQKNFSYDSTSLPSNDLIASNALFVNFSELSKLKKQAGAKDKFYVKIKGKIMEILGTEDVPNGKIAMGKIFRQMLSIGSADQVKFEFMYDKQPPKTTLTKIKISCVLRDKNADKMEIEEDDIVNAIKKLYTNTPFNTSQILFINFQGYNFFLNIDMLYINPLGPLDEDEDNKSNMVNFGFLKDNTKIEVTSQTNIVKIKSKNMKTKAVTKFNFKFD